MMYKGQMGLAWDWDRKPTEPAHAAHLGSWIVEAAWAHPFWPQYIFSLIHLRPIEGTPEPEIVVPGSTHQLFVYALNPDYKLNPDSNPEEPLRHLLPQNHCLQFKVASDEVAKDKVLSAIKLIIEGKLSPDTDFRRAFEAFFQEEASDVEG